MDDVETLRYPVGRFSRLTSPLDRATRSAHIDTIEQTPAKFRSLVNGRSDAELDTPYRPGGWTVRQVVHHVPDSHMNAYIRMKFAITEEAPAIKPYDGGAAGSENGSARDVDRAARGAAPPVGGVSAGAAGRRVRQGVRASGTGTRDARRGDYTLRLALPASCLAHRARTEAGQVGRVGRVGRVGQAGQGRAAHVGLALHHGPSIPAPDQRDDG